MSGYISLQLLISSSCSTHCFLSRYSLSLAQQYVREKLNSFVPSILTWCGEFLHPQTCATRGEMELTVHEEGSRKTTKANVAVSSVLDIEENVLCPR